MASQTLLNKIQQQIRSLEKCLDRPQHDMLRDQGLEEEGTELWNVCTRLCREDRSKSSAGIKLVLMSRVLAFLILHSCQWSAKCDAETVSRLLGLALRVAKLCIGLHIPLPFLPRERCFIVWLT